jgi:Flp pilus assembly protein TadG
MKPHLRTNSSQAASPSPSGSTGRSKDRRRRSRGQSLVEFAVVFPVFILVLFGIIEFGFMLYSQMTVSNAAREAARVSVVDPDPCTIPDLARATGLSAASGLNSAYLSINGSVPNCTKAKQGDTVTVTVTYTYHTFFPLFFGASFNESQQIQMALW